MRDEVKEKMRARKEEIPHFLVILGDPISLSPIYTHLWFRHSRL